MNETNLVTKVWNYATILRDSGVGYTDYVSQLTYLLFLKMDDECATVLHQKSLVPEGYQWSKLKLLSGIDLEKKYNAAHVALSLIAAGAVGNMTDRIIYDYVMDYIYFSVIRFPIFNMADIYVTVATVMMLILLLFVYKEDDLNFLRFKEKRLREID